MNADFHAAMERLLDQQELTEEAVNVLIGSVMDGETSPAQTAALLTALRIKGETESEIAGAARAMHDRAAKLRPTRTGLLDTCGTGGDSHHTFNISTATALVVAAAGVPVAKHGNRSVSSSSGSADVLEQFGVNLMLTPDQVAECIDEVGIGFMFAPMHHGAMKHAAPIRKELVFRTIFNLLGPLTNPASAEFQLLGANTVGNARKLAGALQRLNRPRAFVVCGDASLDEVSLWGETTVFRVEAGALAEETWTPNSFGLPACSVDELKVDSAEASASVIRSVFAGEAGAARNMVVVNAAAGLLAAGAVGDLVSGVAKASETIDSGAATGTLDKLVSKTQGFGES